MVSIPAGAKIVTSRALNVQYGGHIANGAKHVVDSAIENGYTVFDNVAEAAVHDIVHQGIQTNDPFIFYGAGHGNECYSEDTELLTEEGWKLFSDLRKDEKVATLSPVTEELEYQKPIRYFKYRYKGEMFYQDGKSINLLVTPNHNLWVSWLQQGGMYAPFKFLKPTDLGNGIRRDKLGRFIASGTTKSHLKFKRDARWTGREEEYFILPSSTYNIVNQSGLCVTKKISEKKIRMDDFLRFFGIWLAEGCTYLGRGKKKRKNGNIAYHNNHRITITQNNDKKREIIRKWMMPIAEQVGFKFWEHKNPHSRAFEFRNKQMYSYLRKFGKSKDRYVPMEIKRLSSRQLKILFDAMSLGDGYRYKTGIQYSTTSKTLADDVQEIALKIGRGASICKDKRGSNSKSLYSVSVLNGHSNPLCQKDGRGYIDYDGYVYSIEVPNHLLYVRREGKGCWSGNSTFTGDNLDVIFTIENCGILAGRLVDLHSCSTGSRLGPEIIKKGGVSFLGYAKDWGWLTEEGVDPSDPDADPYDSIYAKPFWESANQYMVSLFAGRETEKAYMECYEKYNEWIEYWKESGDPYAAQVIGLLAYDRDIMVLIEEILPPPPPPLWKPIVAMLPVFGIGLVVNKWGL